MARHSSARSKPAARPRGVTWADRRPPLRPVPVRLVVDRHPPKRGAARRVAPERSRTAGRVGSVGSLGPVIRGVGIALLLAAVGLAVVVAVVPVVAGGTALTVLSSSMTPTFRAGDLVVIRPRPAPDIRVGDVMAFTAPDPATGGTRTVTHRVIGVEPGPQFRTKGDANTVPDPLPVAAADVRGVEWYVLPVVGGWGTALRTVPGTLVAAGAVLVVAAMVLLPPRRR